MSESSEMVSTRQNVLLLMSDQHRADCIGRYGRFPLSTPNLDELSRTGTDFRKAYSATALCAPARRTLHTGLTGYSHGVLGDDARVVLKVPTLASLLAEQGYRTHATGKLHLWPKWDNHGFQSMDRADWVEPRDDNDYSRFMRRHAPNRRWMKGESDFDPHSRQVNPWDLDEDLHYSAWCTNSALEFLKSRPAQQPFFLMVSFLPPHPPLFPMPDLYDKYLASHIPPPHAGEWSRFLSDPPASTSPLAWNGALDKDEMHSFRAAYLACIEQVDDHIGTLLESIPNNTLILYLSDHGDMLGDHFLYRKRGPYEGSARIPLLIRLPDGVSPKSAEIHTPVELMDIAPTILESIGLPIPAWMDGSSLLPLLYGGQISRQHIHGENVDFPPMRSGMQFITDGYWKFIWFPSLGQEQLFHIGDDPHETTDLSNNPRLDSTRTHFRQLLIHELAGRPEGFTDGHSLLRVPMSHE
jgi:arylsulfatase